VSLDTHTLTGAYALDAVEDVERRRFEAHLLGCPGCVQEVGELRATAARLGLAVTQQPPAGLRDEVFAQIRRVRQDRPGRPPSRRARDLSARRPWLVRLSAVAAAVVLAGAAALGVLVARADHQLDGARERLAQAQATNGPLGSVLSAPDAHTIAATGGSGVGTATLVVSTLRGAGILTVSGMPHQPADRTYQAWVIGADGPRSAGVLGSTGTDAPTLVRGLRGGRTIAVTVEPAGGSTQPTGIPVLQLNLAS
jgi:anti-sigma-K factor RskA